MKPIVLRILYLLPLFMLLSMSLSGNMQALKEYQVKAVFLFNFTQFVEWPDDTFLKPDSPLVIGILGENPFGAYLEETIRNEKVDEHPLTIRKISTVGEAKECQIVFINISNTGKLKEIISGLKGQRVLTVGDANNFAKSGGIVRFYTENNKIRIRVNLEAAKANGLTISSKLLRLADIVETQEK